MRNTPLTRLFLADNRLNDEDAVLIAQALKHNDNMRILRIQDNQFTNCGRDAIRKAFYDTPSLNLLAGCNHTCKVQLTNKNEFNEDNDKSVNRRLKLYQLLSSRSMEGNNVYHLNLELDDEDDDSLSLKLVPRVLNCAHHYYPKNKQLLIDPENTVHPLSIMYEILGSWKMPALFEQKIGVN